MIIQMNIRQAEAAVTDIVEGEEFENGDMNEEWVLPGPQKNVSRLASIR